MLPLFGLMRCNNANCCGYLEPLPMRVLIVDDHRIVASGCRALFAEDPEIVMLEASDAESGERVFTSEHPDICVLDINLPTVSGFELARRILGRDGSARILMFSMTADTAFASRATASRPAVKWGMAGFTCPRRSREALHSQDLHSPGARCPN